MARKNESTQRRGKPAGRAKSSGRSGAAKPKAGTIVGVVHAAIMARIKAGVTVYRLSKDSGINPTTMARFVSGENNLRADSLGRVCDMLGLELRPKEGV